MEFIKLGVCMLICIYFGVAICLALIWTFGKFTVSITLKKENTKQEISGIKKFLVCIVMGLAWPYLVFGG